jgi:hypothetical protein
VTVFVGDGGSSTVTVGVGVGVRRACMTTGDGVVVLVGAATAVEAGTPEAGCSCGNCVVPGTLSGRVASTSTSAPSTTITADASANRPAPPRGSSSGPRRAAVSADREPGRRGRTPAWCSSSSTETRSRRLRALRVMNDLHPITDPGGY